MRTSSFVLCCAMLIAVVTWCAGMVAFGAPEFETISLAPDASYPQASEPVIRHVVVEIAEPTGHLQLFPVT